VDSPVQQRDTDFSYAVLFIWLHMPLHFNGANSEMLLVLDRGSFSVELSYSNEFCHHLEGG
jgi:hypothetical protein